jgi:hypothetical protein
MRVKLQMSPEEGTMQALAVVNQWAKLVDFALHVALA